MTILVFKCKSLKQQFFIVGLSLNNNQNQTAIYKAKGLEENIFPPWSRYIKHPL